MATSFWQERDESDTEYIIGWVRRGAARSSPRGTFALVALILFGYLVGGLLGRILGTGVSALIDYSNLTGTGAALLAFAVYLIPWAVLLGVAGLLDRRSSGSGTTSPLFVLPLLVTAMSATEPERISLLLPANATQAFGVLGDWFGAAMVVILAVLLIRAWRARRTASAQ